jgi:hypothetical protein
VVVTIAEHGCVLEIRVVVSDSAIGFIVAIPVFIEENRSSMLSSSRNRLKYWTIAHILAHSHAVVFLFFSEIPHLLPAFIYRLKWEEEAMKNGCDWDWIRN